MPKHRPRGPKPKRVRWFVRDGCVRVYGSRAAKDAVLEAQEAYHAAPKSKRGGWTTQKAGKEGMGSGIARGRDILDGHSVDAVQVAQFFRRKAKVQREQEAKGKTIEESPQLQAWGWWGGDPMWWLAEEAIRKAEKKHGKKFGRCKKSSKRAKNAAPSVPEGFEGLPIQLVEWDWRSDPEYANTDYAEVLQVTMAEYEDPLAGWIADIHQGRDGLWRVNEDDVGHVDPYSAGMDAFFHWKAYERDVIAKMTDEEVDRAMAIFVPAVAMPGTKAAPQDDLNERELNAIKRRLMR